MSHRYPSQRGALALVVALCLPLLLGLVAVVLDLGRAYVLKAEVQNAMDACALAASASLTGINDPTIFDTARAHALALTNPAIQGAATRPAESVNRLHFQSEYFRTQDIEVAFSSQVDGTYVAATSTNPQGLSPALARYVRCRYTDSQRALWMVPVLQAIGLSTGTTLSVPAQAVAALQPAQLVCAAPMAICATPGRTAAQNWGMSIGQRLTAVNNPGSGYGSGNFGWADFTPPQGGASELAALLEGSGACSVRVGQAVGQSGQISSIGRSWNTRFGIYQNASQANNSPPDRTGWGFASGSSNLGAYLTQRAQNSAFQGATGGGQVKLTASDHQRLGQQRRIVTAPVVDCTSWNGGKGSATPPILDLACMLMLAPIRSGSGPSGQGVAATMDLEFLGRAGQPGSPCATSGLVGGVDGTIVPGLVQ